jgi:hypothetical protein
MIASYLLQWQILIINTNKSTDASHPLSGPRFSQLLISFRPAPSQSIRISSSPSNQPQPRNPADLLDNMTHFTTPTLAHFIALLSHPAAHFPPSNTSLIIVDSLSTLIANAYPRPFDLASAPKKHDGTSLTLHHFLTSSLSFSHPTFRLSHSFNSKILSISFHQTPFHPGIHH